MTIAEQVQARVDAVDRLSPEHLATLERWAEVEEEHRAIVAFLHWAGGRLPRSQGGRRALVSRYLAVDEAVLDDARRALDDGRRSESLWTVFKNWYDRRETLTP